MKRRYQFTPGAGSLSVSIGSPISAQMREQMMIQKHTLKEMKRRGYYPDDVVGLLKQGRVYRRDNTELKQTEIIFDEEVIFSF